MLSRRGFIASLMASAAAPMVAPGAAIEVPCVYLITGVDAYGNVITEMITLSKVVR